MRFFRYVLYIAFLCFSPMGVGCHVPPDAETQGIETQNTETPPDSDHGSHTGGASHADDDIGLVELAIMTVPEQVHCLRIQADGPYRQKTDLLNVTPGAEFSQTLSGYPLGLVAFRAEAFSQVCASVTTRTVAAWASDTVTAPVVEGSKAKVVFQMYRNGRLDALFDFASEPACSDEGIACRSKNECCSGICSGGLCQPEPE